MSSMTISHHAPRAGCGQVRLTRRGRLVVLATALLAVLAVGVFLASGSVATDQPGTPEPTRVIRVDTGQTLWDIAADLADDGDVRAMVDHIEHLNALDSGMLVAGQRLVVPVAG
jgi:LysM domain